MTENYYLDLETLNELRAEMVDITEEDMSPLTELPEQQSAKHL